jgi:hypothetical protein
LILLASLVASVLVWVLTEALCWMAPKPPRVERLAVSQDGSELMRYYGSSIWRGVDQTLEGHNAIMHDQLRVAIGCDTSNVEKGLMGVRAATISGEIAAEKLRGLGRMDARRSARSKATKCRNCAAARETWTDERCGYCGGVYGDRD